MIRQIRGLGEVVWLVVNQQSPREGECETQGATERGVRHDQLHWQATLEETLLTLSVSVKLQRGQPKLRDRRTQYPARPPNE